jgi:hypothetical protein
MTTLSSAEIVWLISHLQRKINGEFHTQEVQGNGSKSFCQRRYLLEFCGLKQAKTPVFNFSRRMPLSY